VTTLQIVDGDSKDKLLLQLADIGRVKDRPAFRFMLSRNDRVCKLWADALIFGITALDTSGENWLLDGVFVDMNQLGNHADPGAPANFMQCRYSTRTRKGHLVLEAAPS